MRMPQMSPVCFAVTGTYPLPTATIARNPDFFRIARNTAAVTIITATEIAADPTSS